MFSSSYNKPYFLLALSWVQELNHGKLHWPSSQFIVSLNIMHLNFIAFSFLLSDYTLSSWPSQTIILRMGLKSPSASLCQTWTVQHLNLMLVNYSNFVVHFVSITGYCIMCCFLRIYTFYIEPLQMLLYRLLSSTLIK